MPLTATAVTVGSTVRRLLAASTVVAVLALAGCAGDSDSPAESDSPGAGTDTASAATLGPAEDSPTDATKDEFCAALNAQPALDDSLADASAADQAAAIKDQTDQAAARFMEVGTPQDIPKDARRGFEISVDSAAGLSQDDIQKAIEDQDASVFDPEVTGDEQGDLDAFRAWSSIYCL